MMAAKRRKAAKRVGFENPLDVRLMAIDGTWCRDCQLIDVSETEARIRPTGSAVKDSEFFLLLTKFGDPVFRMCIRTWVDGTLMGVSFHRDFIRAKTLAQLRREAELVGSTQPDESA
jgi:hypothetical protein